MQEVCRSQWRQIFVQDIGRKWYKRSEGVVIGGVLSGWMCKMDQLPFISLSETSLGSSCEYSSFSC